MKFTLHKTKEGFIVTSDEGSRKGELTIFPDTENGKIVKLNRPVIAEYDYASNGIHNLKVIAQQDQIDFSALTEEERKKIGWFDIETLANQYSDYETKSKWGDIVRNSYEAGFQKAMELMSDKLFTLEDMSNAIEMAKEVSICECVLGTHIEHEHYEGSIIKTLHKTSWEIEVEMEPKIALDGHSILGQEPKFTNRKIKITKIL